MRISQGVRWAIRNEAAWYSVSILDGNRNPAVSGAGSKATARIDPSIGFAEV